MPWPESCRRVAGAMAGNKMPWPESCCMVGEGFRLRFAMVWYSFRVVLGGFRMVLGRVFVLFSDGFRMVSVWFGHGFEYPWATFGRVFVDFGVPG